MFFLNMMSWFDQIISFCMRFCRQLWIILPFIRYWFPIYGSFTLCPIIPIFWIIWFWCRQYRNFRHFQHSNFPDWKRHGFPAFWKKVLSKRNWIFGVGGYRIASGVEEVCRQHRNFRHFKHSNFPDWKRHGSPAFWKKVLSKRKWICRQHRNFRHFEHSNFPDWKRYGFCAFWEKVLFKRNWIFGVVGYRVASEDEEVFLSSSILGAFSSMDSRVPRP